jgi:hypothetical protein
LYDQLSDPILANAFGRMIFLQRPVFSHTFVPDTIKNISYLSTVIADVYGIPKEDMPKRPMAQLYFPVVNAAQSQIVGAVSTSLDWALLLSRFNVSQKAAIVISIENTCGQTFTFCKHPGDSVLEYVGDGDYRNERFDHMVESSTYEEIDTSLDLAVAGLGLPFSENNDGDCRYRFRIYPTTEFEDLYVSNDPYLYAAGVILIFVFTSLVFVLYDRMVRRRQAIVMASAKRNNYIVASLFPSNVRTRLLSTIGDSESGYERRGSGQSLHYNPLRRRTNESDEVPRNNDAWYQSPSSVYGSGPIADLFASATVLFVDIAGFTAWSSEREPSQVRFASCRSIMFEK